MRPRPRRSPRRCRPRRPSASDTSTSALISKAVSSPINASVRMGTPHRIMAAHAISKGKGLQPSILAISAAPESTSRVTSFFYAAPFKQRFDFVQKGFHYLCALFLYLWGYMYIIGAEIYPVKRDKAKKRYFCTVKVKKTVTLRCGRMVFNDRNENVRLRAVDAVKSIHNGIETPKARMRRTAGAVEGDSPSTAGKAISEKMRLRHSVGSVSAKKYRVSESAGAVLQGWGGAKRGRASALVRPERETRPAVRKPFRPFERLMRDTAIACWQSVRPLW